MLVLLSVEFTHRWKYVCVRLSITFVLGNEDFVSIQESFLFNHMQRMCFSLAVLQDSIPELDEELTIYLLTISSGFIVHRVFATLTIRDDDGKVIIHVRHGSDTCCATLIRVPLSSANI